MTIADTAEMRVAARLDRALMAAFADEARARAIGRLLTEQAVGRMIRHEQIAVIRQQEGDGP